MFSVPAQLPAAGFCLRVDVVGKNAVGPSFFTRCDVVCIQPPCDRDTIWRPRSIVWSR